jgi:hypothetical protein
VRYLSFFLVKNYMKKLKIKGTVEEQRRANFFTTDQLLTKIPASKRTIKNMRDNGLIPYVKVGHKVLFFYPDVEAALRRQQIGPVPNGHTNSPLLSLSGES